MPGVGDTRAATSPRRSSAEEGNNTPHTPVPHSPEAGPGAVPRLASGSERAASKVSTRISGSEPRRPQGQSHQTHRQSHHGHQHSESEPSDSGSAPTSELTSESEWADKEGLPGSEPRTEPAGSAASGAMSGDHAPPHTSRPSDAHIGAHGAPVDLQAGCRERVLRQVGNRHNSKIQRQRERQAELRERAQILTQTGRTRAGNRSRDMRALQAVMNMRDVTGMHDRCAAAPL